MYGINVENVDYVSRRRKIYQGTFDTVIDSFSTIFYPFYNPYHNSFIFYFSRASTKIYPFTDQKYFLLHRFHRVQLHNARSDFALYSWLFLHLPLVFYIFF